MRGDGNNVVPKLGGLSTRRQGTLDVGVGSTESGHLVHARIPEGGREGRSDRRLVVSQEAPGQAPIIILSLRI